jgi:ADP-ribose pyrophosphatase YjhB (NUDIX family)
LSGSREQPYLALFAANFTAAAFSVHWDPSTRLVARELQTAIESAWERLDPNPHFNGRIIRLDNWSLSSEELVLYLSPTDYQSLLYSNAHVEEIVDQWGEEALAQALGISAVVVSADDRVVLMRRSDKVGEYPGCFDVFGGHIDLPEPAEKPDPFVSMAKELDEELALAAGTYSLHCFGLLKARKTRKPELLFIAQCAEESEGLLQAAARARDRFEYTGLLSIVAEADAIREFLYRNGSQVSPSAFGALEMFADSITTIEKGISYAGWHGNGR